MRFEEAYAGWNGGRLTQAEAGRLLGVRVLRYASGAIAIFHGPRGLAYFTPDGSQILETLLHAA